jgi:hypothetical protein
LIVENLTQSPFRNSKDLPNELSELSETIKFIEIAIKPLFNHIDKQNSELQVNNNE